ncbi:MAG: cell division protein FtsW [Candidatus Magasanikbacteria bacterium]|nr:cell division protein FtsW [Candidatus Magasanikbacteria bacterium]
MMVSHTPARRADRLFLLYLGILAVFGLMALMSASTPVGYAKFGDAYFFVKRQVLLGLIPGSVLFFLFAKLDYHVWRKLGWVLYGVTLLLLSLVFVPGIGVTINHSRSWLAVAGHNFQPVEIGKLALAIVLAILLSDGKRDWTNWQTSLVPVLAIIAPILFLVLLQPDVGTLSILVTIVFMALFIAKVPNKYLVWLGAAGAACFIGLVIAAPYRAARLTTFLHPELDPKGVGYQMNQAFLAIGSGGFWGLGFGHSRQKFQYLPEVSADSIFAVIAEENGFLVSFALVALILLLSWRGFAIAKHAPDSFGYLLVSAIMVWWVWQSFLNIGAMVGALPLTGVPLPFVSHGGSALTAALAAAGIVVSVSRQARV